ncbi:MAG TPA: LysM peptidoglycan-binding domain-containing protein [Tahibacter sp.]|uniref:CIS tube protein n=1 Tax=Tahibacter sp. TaxID=2056211 RepID=UPI002C85F459|nr:LysM peptidoglycan-binding domain-containing protein [Tahibacter sp.]HSX63069.1 LysM peptidoglycan-binding domain-containing protein [Tahibacter sp.]
MSIPVKGQLWIEVGENDFDIVEVQFNPTELSFEKNAQLAEINIPGLDAPIQQFVRGQAERLTLELFCDTTEDGIGANARSVTAETDKFFQLVKIIPTLHAPPVVTFSWHDEFPGNRLGEQWGNQRRTSFTGMAESVRQKFTMFSPEGVPLRATVTLVLREWRPIEQQFNELNLSSPDRTHAHVLAAGETLSALAARYYERPGLWRPIAEANGIDDPRRLTPGAVLLIPAQR